MGAIVTAVIYFIFGFVIGSIVVTAGLSVMVYDDYKYENVVDSDSLKEMYHIGKKLHNMT